MNLIPLTSVSVLISFPSRGGGVPQKWSAGLERYSTVGKMIAFHVAELVSIPKPHILPFHSPKSTKMV